MSQLMRYSTACGSYHDFLERELLLPRNLLKQRLLVIIMKLTEAMVTSDNNEVTIEVLRLPP